MARTSMGTAHSGVAGNSETNSGRQHLAFTLNGEVFAIEILQIREIIEFGALTEVPMMPDLVRGVINLRGAVVPVVDLNARFGRSASELCKKSCIVIFDTVRAGERVELGILVDAVSEVIKIAPGDIEAPPDFGSVVQREFIRGIGKAGSRFVILLEPERALDVQEMAQLCEQRQEAAVA